MSADKDRMPELSWVRLSPDEVKTYFCSVLDKKMPNFDNALTFAKSIHHLVEQGRIKAYRTPEGTVEFQYNIAKEICPEGNL